MHNKEGYMNSGKALALRFKHWTPKGGCKVTGNKEKNKKTNRTKKKSSPKNGNRLQLYNKKSLKNRIGPKKKPPKN